MNWIEFKDRCSRFLWFDKKEVLNVVILVLVFAFIFSFNMWGVDSFNAFEGFNNLVIAFVLVAVVVLLHHFVQRIMAILFGYEPVHKTWWPGLILSLLFVVFSNGNLMFYIGSVFNVKMREYQRIGWQRYGLNVKQQGLIAVFGNVAVLLLIGVLKLFTVVPDSFLYRMISFSIVFVFFNMIPWPHSDGLLMMLGSRLYFAFLAGFLIGFFVFLSSGFLMAAFLGLLTGIIAWFVFYWFFERKWT
ncbi:hypothetical protein GF358_03045 [Candidatus Woesearchaeota archaeon]|nr:hypothetical protein [Candidatus Woesearchaeota archaeon]